MTPSPKVPKEQRSFAARGARPLDDALSIDRRDLVAGLRSGQPGDAAANTATRGRFGDLKQNPTTHWKVQDR